MGDQPGGVVTFSPDGALIAGVSGTGVFVWDAETSRTVMSEPLDDARAVAFSPDGRRVISGDRFGSVRVWDVETGRQVRVVAAHLGEVADIGFSPDGAVMATSSSDGTIRLWDGRTLDPMMTIARDAVGGIDFTSDGDRLAYVADGGIVRVLALRIDDLMKIARSRLTRSWSEEECRTYLHLDACP